MLEARAATPLKSPASCGTVLADMDPFINTLLKTLYIIAVIIVMAFIFAGPAIWPMIRKRLNLYFDDDAVSDLASLNEFELDLLRDTAKAGNDQLRALAQRIADEPTRPIHPVNNESLRRLANYLAEQDDPVRKLERLEYKRRQLDDQIDAGSRGSY